MEVWTRPGAMGTRLLTARHRRKYRKMRVRFEDTMTASNNLILDEWKAQGTARRLREQNECVGTPSTTSAIITDEVQPNPRHSA